MVSRSEYTCQWPLSSKWNCDRIQLSVQCWDVRGRCAVSSCAAKPKYKMLRFRNLCVQPTSGLPSCIPRQSMGIYLMPVVMSTLSPSCSLPDRALRVMNPESTGTYSTYRDGVSVPAEHNSGPFQQNPFLCCGRGRKYNDSMKTLHTALVSSSSTPPEPAEPCSPPLLSYQTQP